MCKHVHGLLHVHGSKGPRADYAYVCMHVHARRISSDIGVRRAVYVCAWLYVVNASVSIHVAIAP